MPGRWDNFVADIEADITAVWTEITQYVFTNDVTRFDWQQAYRDHVNTQSDFSFPVAVIVATDWPQSPESPADAVWKRGDVAIWYVDFNDADIIKRIAGKLESMEDQVYSGVAHSTISVPLNFHQNWDPQNALNSHLNEQDLPITSGYLMFSCMMSGTGA